jgi:hypothetical protein
MCLKQGTGEVTVSSNRKLLRVHAVSHECSLQQVGFQEDLIHGSHGANLSSPVLNFENAGDAGCHKHSHCVGKGFNHCWTFPTKPTSKESMSIFLHILQ